MERLIRTGRIAVLICGVILSLLAHSLTYGQTPSALVLEVRGNSNPPLQPYSEMPAGSTVSLSKTSQLVFVHYTTCRTVTVMGGTVTFAVDTYTLAGENERSVARSPCPRTVILQESEGRMAGSLARGTPFNPSLSLSPQPSFLLVGKRASDFTSIKVSKDDREVLQSPFDGKWFRWPKGVAPLTKGEVYHLSLVPKTGNGAQVIAPFTVIGASSRAASEELMLVRVD
jgi:hypothetical protein